MVTVCSESTILYFRSNVPVQEGIFSHRRSTSVWQDPARCQQDEH
jgi:hypothetical protein